MDFTVSVEIETMLAEMVAHAQGQVRQMGLWAPNHPVGFGGPGLSTVDHGLLSEALGRSPLGHTVFGVQAPDAGNIEILDTHAPPEQRERWLAPLVAGEIRSCFSMTEPETASIEFSVANTMLKAVDTAIEVHGALGVTDDTILSYRYRHERAACIYDGADEVHKTSLGRRILRRYGN